MAKETSKQLNYNDQNFIKSIIFLNSHNRVIGDTEKMQVFNYHTNELVNLTPKNANTIVENIIKYNIPVTQNFINNLAKNEEILKVSYDKEILESNVTPVNEYDKNFLKIKKVGPKSKDAEIDIGEYSKKRDKLALLPKGGKGTQTAAAEETEVEEVGTEKTLQEITDKTTEDAQKASTVDQPVGSVGGVQVGGGTISDVPLGAADIVEKSVLAKDVMEMKEILALREKANEGFVDTEKVTKEFPTAGLSEGGKYSIKEEIKKTEQIVTGATAAPVPPPPPPPVVAPTPAAGSPPSDPNAGSTATGGTPDNNVQTEMPATETPATDNNPPVLPNAPDQIEAKYHENSVRLYLGNPPQWDFELYNNIKRSNYSAEERIKIMNSIIKEFGDKLFIYERKSDTVEELNEMLQLQFCWQRNLQVGTRARQAMVPLSSLISFANKLNPKTPLQATGLQGTNAPPPPPTTTTTATETVATAPPPEVPVVPATTQVQPLQRRVIIPVSEKQANDQIIESFDIRSKSFDTRGRPLANKTLIKETEKLKKGNFMQKGSDERDPFNFYRYGTLPTQKGKRIIISKIDDNN